MRGCRKCKYYIKEYGMPRCLYQIITTDEQLLALINSKLKIDLCCKYYRRKWWKI